LMACAAAPYLARVEGRMPSLGVPERVLLFCVASYTDWQKAGITGATITAMVVKGLLERDAVGTLTLTDRGRAVLQAMLSEL
jgi:hypothetical protein